MVHSAYRSALVVSTSAALLLAGCRSKSSAPSGVGTKPLPSAPPVAVSARPAGTPSAPTSSVAPGSSASSHAELAAPPLETGEVFVGRAQHVAVGRVGVVAVQRGDELVVSPMRSGVVQPFADPGTELATVPLALVDGEASAVYWISRGRLVRRKIAADGTAQQLEVLASDAADGTRLSAGRPQRRADDDVVMYIGREVSKELERAPRLWVEKHGSQRVSTEAGGATSVTVVGLGGNRFALLTLDGRVAMSPVHAISLELDADGAPHLGEDRVVYVAGPAERRTAITGVRVGPGPVALLPISKDDTHFGLLSLLVGDGDAEAPSSWVDYPNGLDPAPATALVLCGEPRVLFARPENASPRAQRVLDMGRIGADGKVTDTRTLAKAGAIREISAWASASGAKDSADKSPAGWAVLVTDVGVIARPLTCD